MLWGDRRWGECGKVEAVTRGEDAHRGQREVRNQGGCQGPVKAKGVWVALGKEWEEKQGVTKSVQFSSAQSLSCVRLFETP